MVAALTPCWLAALSLVAVAVAVANAEPLPDPTRPPSAILAPTSGTTEAGEPAGGLILQSTLIAPDRRAAVISGRSMTVGDAIGGFRLVRVAPTEVMLEGSEGARTLKLFPDVKKRAASVAETTHRTRSADRHER